MKREEAIVARSLTVATNDQVINDNHPRMIHRFLNRQIQISIDKKNTPLHLFIPEKEGRIKQTYVNNQRKVDVNILFKKINQ